MSHTFILIHERCDNNIACNYETDVDGVGGVNANAPSQMMARKILLAVGRFLYLCLCFVWLPLQAAGAWIAAS